MGATHTWKSNRIEAVRAAILEGAPLVAKAAAQADLDSMRHQIVEEAKSGRKYPDLPNRSSAPFEAPANQLGGLLASIPDEPVEVPGGFAAVAGDGSGVATYLELGTSRMAPRPFAVWAHEAGAEANLAGMVALADSAAKA